MKSFEIPCKINLNLHIVGRREDGYHLLDSLFYPINSPCDTIIIEESQPAFSVECDTEGIDLTDNTLTKIYKEFSKEFNFSPKFKLRLIKGIPHGAGLGGGSADAAFLLKYLFALYKGEEFSSDYEIKDKDMQLLIDIALKVGADIPFFLHNRPMRVEGIGEECSFFDASPLKGLILLLISPKIKVNTIEAYKEFRKKNQNLQEKVKKNAPESLTIAIKNAINPDSTMSVSNSFFINDLESSVFALYPQLEQYKKKMISLNARVALMSGSGSSIFGIFTSREDANKAREYFLENNITAYELIDF